jgi:hypothetical protein
MPIIMDRGRSCRRRRRYIYFYIIGIYTLDSSTTMPLSEHTTLNCNNFDK